MTNRIPKKTGEFSQTVSHYSQYRPDYPEDLFNLLKNKGYGAHSVIADIGAGTGLLTKDLIKLNAEVIAVEPNAKMFAELEHQFSNQKKLSLLPNAAESTQLPQASIDLITVATAFHWFDRVKCRQEFRRILKPSGEALLVWNLRIPELSPFIADYEAFLQTYCPLYKGTPEMQMDEAEVCEFFAKDTVTIYRFPNTQLFDLEGLIGRWRSTSYALLPEQDNYQAAIAHLTALFEQYQCGGELEFVYQCKAYLGGLEK